MGWVNVTSAACKSISMDAHGALASEVLHDGGGWLPRADAIAFARRLLLDAGDGTTAEMLAEERERGRRLGYEQGWANALRVTGGITRCLCWAGRLSARRRPARTRMYFPLQWSGPGGG